MKYLLSIMLLLVCETCYGEFRIIHPLRAKAEDTVLADIDSQLKPGHPYQDKDKVTWGHEGTHGVNSRIRNSFGVKNGFYLLNGDCFVIDSPKFTLTDVANKIPIEKRGPIYKLYLVDAAKTPPGFGGNWDNYPLYILDELTAYINGCLVGIEYDLQNRTIYSYKCVLEMWTYALYMQDMARKSGFKDQEKLDNFMNFVYNKRILLIKNQIELRNWYNRR